MPKCVQRNRKPLAGVGGVLFVPDTDGAVFPESAPKQLTGFVSDCFANNSLGGDAMCAATLGRLTPEGGYLGRSVHFGVNRGNADPTFNGWVPAGSVPTCSGTADRALCAFDDNVGYANSLYQAVPPVNGNPPPEVALADRATAAARCCAGESGDCFPNWCDSASASGVNGPCWSPGQVPDWLLGRPEPRAFAEAYCATLGPGGLPAKPNRAPFVANPDGDPLGGRLCDQLRAWEGGSAYERAMRAACFADGTTVPEPWFSDAARSNCAAWCGRPESGACRDALRAHCGADAVAGGDFSAECACFRSPDHYAGIRAGVLARYAAEGPDGEAALRDTRAICTDARCAGLPGAVVDPEEAAQGPCPAFSLARCVAYDDTPQGAAGLAVRPECLHANGGPFRPLGSPPDDECAVPADCPQPPTGSEALCVGGACVNVPVGGGNKCVTSAQCSQTTRCAPDGVCRPPCVAAGDCPEPPAGQERACTGGLCVPVAKKPPPDDDGDGEDAALSAGAIAGIAVGGVVLLGFLVLVGVVMATRRRDRRRQG